MCILVQECILAILARMNKYINRCIFATHITMGAMKEPHCTKVFWREENRAEILIRFNLTVIYVGHMQIWCQLEKGTL